LFPSCSLIANVDVVKDRLQQELLRGFLALVGLAQSLAQVRAGVFPVKFPAHRTIRYCKALIGAPGEWLIFNARKQISIMPSAKAIKNRSIIDAYLLED
jgi:hypothetical protein